MSRFFSDEQEPALFLKIKMRPEQVHFFTKIMEAYTHLVFVSHLNTCQGIVGLFATPENLPEVREILQNFPYPVEILE